MNYKTPSERVAAEVRAELARAQIKIKDLAPELEMSVSTLQRRLSGEIPFDVEELTRIAEIANVSPAAFFSCKAA